MKLNPKYKTHRIAVWMAAAALLSVTGCVTIDDNTDDCFPLVRLHFEYTNNLDERDKFREQVESIDLYVYKQQDSSLVATKRYSQADLIREDYSVALRWLRQDDYYIIAFGNYNETDYRCSAYDGCMTDMRLRMICDDGQGKLANRNPKQFFYGMIELAKHETGEKLLDMTKDTKDIYVTVRYKNTTRAAEGLPDLAISITAQNGTLKHDNSIAGEDLRTMTHISDCSFAQYETSLQTMIRVGRLFENDGSAITIMEKETGKVISTGDLTDNLLDIIIDQFAGDPEYAGMDPEEYLDKQDKYYLEYEAEMKYGVLVTTLITVNGWSTHNNPIGGV